MLLNFSYQDQVFNDVMLSPKCWCKFQLVIYQVL